MAGQSMRLIVNSIRGVSRILQDVNPELRDIFNAIGEDLFDAILEELRSPKAKEKDQKESENQGIDIPEIVERISKRRGTWPVPARLGKMPINAIPGGKLNAGQKACVVRATGKWYAKDGFTQIVEQVFDFWDSHERENKITLILTTAWNSEEFKEKFQQRFDDYCQGLHSVAIVYLSNLGYSLQYLR